jgi:hypothetical protein
MAKLSIALNAAGAAVLRIVLVDSETTVDEPAPAEMAEVSVIEATEFDAEPEPAVEEKAGQPVTKDLAFAEGDDVKVFSSSANEWVFGIIEQIDYDGAEAEVRYEVDGEDRTKWVDCSEGSADIKDANEEVAAKPIVVGATHTRSGRDAKRVVYADSDEEEDDESFFEEDEEDAASSDEEFESAEEEEEEEEDEEPPLSKLTVAELKVRLKALSAPVAGKKADLVERLSVLLAAEPVTPGEAPEEVAGADEEMPAAAPEEPDAVSATALVAPAMSAAWAAVHPDSPAAALVAMPDAEVVLAPPEPPSPSPIKAPAMSAVRAAVHPDSPAASKPSGLQDVTNTVAARTTPQGTPAKTPVTVGDMFDLDGFCDQMSELNGTPATAAP